MSNTQSLKWISCWILAAVWLALACGPVFAVTSGTWISAIDGHWNDDVNWQQENIADGIGAIAVFNMHDHHPYTASAPEPLGDNIIPITILIVNRTIGHLVFGPSDYGEGMWTIATADGSPGGRLELNGGGNIPSTIECNEDAFLACGLATGSETLIKGGTDDLTLSGSNEDFTGTWIVREGALRVGENNSLGSLTRVNVEQNGGLAFLESEDFGSLSGEGFVVMYDTNVGVGQDNTSSTFSGEFAGTGELHKLGTGTFTLSGDNGTFTGNIAIQEGVLAAGVNNSLNAASCVTVNSGATLRFVGSENFGSLAGDGTVDVGSYVVGTGEDNTDSEFSGSLTGIGNFRKLGTGTLTLSGNNDNFTGNVIIEVGVLAAAGWDNSSLGALTRVTVDSGATLSFVANENFGSLAGTGTVDFGTTYFTAPTVGVGEDNTDSTFSGSLTGIGDLRKLGTGTMTLAGDNGNFTGNVIVKNGVLTAGVNNSLPSISRVTVDSGATLRFQNDEEFGALAGAGTVEIGPYTIIVGYIDNSTFGGKLDGTGELHKQDTGTQTLTGDNGNFTGKVIVENGFLAAGANNSLGRGPVIIEGGMLRINEGVMIANEVNFNAGKLGGQGTLQHNLTVGKNNIVTPGVGPGILTIDGNYIQTVDGMLEIELGGTVRGTEYDAFIVTGAAGFGGTLNVDLIDGFNPANGDTFDILDWKTLTAASTFDKIDLPSLDPGLEWNTTELYITGSLSVIAGISNDGITTVSGHLYIDTNGNGAQEAGEPDLPDIDVSITDSSNIQRVTTNADGNYAASVLPGTTTVDVDENDPDYPTGYTQTEGDDPTTLTAVSEVDTRVGNYGYSLMSNEEGCDDSGCFIDTCTCPTTPK